MSRSIKRKIMALVVAGVMAMPMASFAQNQPVLISEGHEEVISEKEEMENEFIKTSGEIIELTNTDGNMSILVSLEEDEYGIVFHMADHVSIWDRASEALVKSESLEAGMTVDVFYHQNTPTTMSIPPQLTPGLLVIQEESLSPVYVGIFNEEFVSLDNTLQLNIGEDTVIVSDQGEVLEADDIDGEMVLVFYTMSTKSIPAQTTPSKVVVFEIDVEEDQGVEDEVEDMISLRATAIKLGYKVEWNHQDKSTELTKQNQTMVLKLGSVDYTLNKSLGKFDEAPELRNGSMYVPASILEVIN